MTPFLASYRLRRAPVIVAMSLLLTSHHAMAAQTFLEDALPYSKARALLIERGFRPYVMPGADACDVGDPKCYPEMESCIHKRHWICNYAWKSGKTIYQLETRAEDPVVDSFYCLVNCGRQPEEPDGVQSMPPKHED